MKFVIDKNELTHLIGKLQNVVSQKSTIPILSNFLIEAKSGALMLTATDLTVGLSCCIGAKVIEEGATTLPAKRFFSLVRELTAQNIEITTSEGEISKICADSSEFSLRGMSRNEFPALPDLAGSVQVKMPRELLRDMLYRTSFAVSKEDNRYVLTGVLAEIASGVATFVGTDGRRLAKAHANVELDPSVTGQYIIPFKAVEEMLKNLGENEKGEVTISLLNDKIGLDTGSTRIITKLLSGDYPDYNRVIPQSSRFSVTLHREELITLLKQISLFISDPSQSVRFTFEDGELRMRANTMDIGEGKVCMPVNYTGSRFDIAFNPGFFQDTLRHCKGETVFLELTDSYSPGRIRDSESNNSLFVIMPMRLNED